jgi:two-component system chemotaxis response regulator CheB
LIKKKIFTRKLDFDENITGRWHNSDVLLLGGSAGSFNLIFRVVKNLPPDLNKTVIIIIHRKKNFQSEIERMFAEISSLPLKEISDKDKINKNTVYIAPANYHTLIEKEGYFGLDVSEAVWFSRPSIDITFESAADTYGERCTAILFSGANRDGAQGMLKLKNAGSLTIVQDPAEAEMPEMPEAAININAVDYVLGTNEIFELLKTSSR